MNDNESVLKWLNELTADPGPALQRLVLGQAAVAAWSRASLREIFIEVFQTHAEPMDDALTNWLRGRLMQMPPEPTPKVVWASHLQELFRAMAGLPLPKVARLLRDRLRDFRLWLRPLRTEESLDPEAAYLAALAWAETNQHLEGLWKGLALRRDGEPPYYIDIGLLGLRKTRDDRGELPEKAPFLLLATLIDLGDQLSQKDWLLTTRALLGGYHCSLETWVREFEPVLDARQEAKNGPTWLRKILPLPEAHQHHADSPAAFLPIPLAESNAMVREVLQRGLQADGLEPFLERHRAYADATGNPHFLVRTFNRLAEAARTHNPDWAIARAGESMEWDPSHEFCWTALAHALWARGIRDKANEHEDAAKADFHEAMDILWKARFRFPSNAHVRTELAKFLRATGDFATAEVVYREAEAEFPENPWCFAGYADMLLRRSLGTGSQSELDEALTLFQRASDLGSVYAKTRLQTIRRRQPSALSMSILGEAEQGESLESVELPSQQIAEMGFAQRLGRSLLLQWQARRAKSPDEGEHLFDEAEALLNLAEELTGDCHTAFVEARGFLLLARDRSAKARSYFAQQLADAAPRRPLGLRLGLAEARARLGETLSENEEAELASFGPEGSILPLVLKVVRLLQSTTSDNELRELLLRIYPRVRELAGTPRSELGEEEEEAQPASAAPATRRAETPDTMLAQFLLANVFRPAAIESTADLRKPESLLRVRSSLGAHRDEIFAVAEKLALLS